jgi:hypothetical protein
MLTGLALINPAKKINERRVSLLIFIADGYFLFKATLPICKFNHFSVKK